jgi:type II secretion system protein H
MPACGWRKPWLPSLGGHRRGFTLIEVLIVVVIAALAASIALPGFVRTMRGAQLRNASRTVLMAHKYTRSTSVLRQVPMAMLLDREASELEIITLQPAAGTSDRDRFLDSREARATTAALGGEEVEEKPTIETELIRSLGREVQIESFRSELGGQEHRGVYWILYHPNGMSDGFDLTLSDKNNRRVTIRSDAISGRVEAEFGQF